MQFPTREAAFARRDKITIELIDLETRVRELNDYHRPGVRQQLNRQAAALRKEAIVLIARTPLDQMIDDATGANAAIVSKFVSWFNENIWGDITP